jgi:hypothetical protein
LPISIHNFSFKEWNVEWLFLNSTTKTIKCPGDCPWKREADALLHLKTIASQIRAADADIIVLAEVQDCDVGRVLLQEIGDPTLRFHLIAGTTHSAFASVGALFSLVDRASFFSQEQTRLLAKMLRC